MMKRYAYIIGICVLLFAALTACRADSAPVSGSPETAETVIVTPPPETTKTPDAVTVPDATETPDSATVPDATETPDTVTVPDTAGTPDVATAPDTDTAGTPDAPEVSVSAPVPDSDSGRTESFTTEPLKEARDLTAEELQKWSKFLCQSDCNGFLMSSFDTPLQADLLFVFYSGAGVGEYPSEEMVADYLQANDIEEAYTDILFIPYDKASQVLERRTGYTLEHFKLAGNDILMYYSQKYKGYFHMAGDTNYMRVECVSGRENADGSLFLEVQEISEWNDDSTCSFETTLKPDNTGRNMLFDKNVVTGGWLTWVDEWEEEE